MSRMTLVCLASSLFIGLAIPMGSASADSGDDSVDCFFASNESNPLCQSATSTVPARKSNAITTEYRDTIGESVDCFYAYNAAAPECATNKSRTTASPAPDHVVNANMAHGS